MIAANDNIFMAGEVLGVNGILTQAASVSPPPSWGRIVDAGRDRESEQLADDAGEGEYT